VTFTVSLRSLSTVDNQGLRHVLGGEHGLIVSRGHGTLFVAELSSLVEIIKRCA
jgi:hypothetical protein